MYDMFSHHLPLSLLALLSIATSVCAIAAPHPTPVGRSIDLVRRARTAWSPTDFQARRDAVHAKYHMRSSIEKRASGTNL